MCIRAMVHNTQQQQQHTTTQQHTTAHITSISLFSPFPLTSLVSIDGRKVSMIPVSLFLSALKAASAPSPKCLDCSTSLRGFSLLRSTDTI